MPGTMECKLWGTERHKMLGETSHPKRKAANTDSMTWGIPGVLALPRLKLERHWGTVSRHWSPSEGHVDWTVARVPETK